MHFCIISPIAGLEKYAKQSKRHLILAQLLHNPEYREFYANRHCAGDFIILDNGAYENTKPLDAAAYFNFVCAMSPSVVVLPDHLMSPWRKTTSASLHFLDQYADDPRTKDYQHEWMFVPQCQGSRDSEGSSRKEFWAGLNTVVNDGRQGHKVTWIGLGRYLATEFINLPGHGFRRAELAQQIKKEYPHLKLHALGMAAGSLDELKALRDVGVNSIDSSAPVWRGWNGYRLDQQDEWKQMGTPCDFHAKNYNLETDRGEGQDRLIQNNLQEILNACH